MKKIKKKKLKKAIDKIASELKWKVKNEVGGGYYEVVSDPILRTHIIYWPAPGSTSGPPRLIELAHELVHALFAENIHLQFSGSYFKPGTPENLIREVTWACRSATDWFIDAELMRRCPAEEKKEIQEHVAMIMHILNKKGLENDTFFNISAGFLLAQAKLYFDQEFVCGPAVRSVMEAFLSVPPKTPSIRALEDLTNKVLATYTDLRVQLVRSGGSEVWEIVENKTK